MHLVHQSHTNRYLNVNKGAFQIIPRTPIEIERRWDRFFDCFCHSFWTQFAISHSNNLMKKKRQNTLKTTEYNIQLEHTRAQNTSTLHINLIVPPFQFAIGSDLFFYGIFNQLHSIRTLNLIRETKFLQSIELRSNVRVDSFHLTLMKNSLTCSPETVHGKLQIEKNAYAHALTHCRAISRDRSRNEEKTTFRCCCCLCYCVDVVTWYWKWN